MAALLLAVGAAGWWLGSSADDGADTAASAEIEQLIDDFSTAQGLDSGELPDPEALFALFTDDYLHRSFSYTQVGDQLVTRDNTFTAIDEAERTSIWEAERVGELLVAGDGPWVVAHVNTALGPIVSVEGINIFVVIDEGGTLKVVDSYEVAIDTKKQPAGRTGEFVRWSTSMRPTSSIGPNTLWGRVFGRVG
jgi:hypothetical protein